MKKINYIRIYEFYIQFYNFLRYSGLQVTFNKVALTWTLHYDYTCTCYSLMRGNKILKALYLNTSRYSRVQNMF